MKCEAIDLYDIILNLHQNNEFCYRNIRTGIDVDRLYFIIPTTLYDKEVEYRAPVYESLQFIADVINGNKKIDNRACLDYPAGTTLYPYMKELWGKYIIEMNYYN